MTLSTAPFLVDCIIEETFAGFSLLQPATCLVDCTEEAFALIISMEESLSDPHPSSAFPHANLELVEAYPRTYVKIG
jgi:hypothetical protein